MRLVLRLIGRYFAKYPFSSRLQFLAYIKILKIDPAGCLVHQSTVNDSILPIVTWY